MPLAPRRHQVLNGATVTSSGNSGVLTNFTRSMNPVIIAYLDIKGTVSGTSPQLTVSVWGSVDGVRFAQIGAFTAQSASLSGSNPLRLQLSNVLEQYIQVQWAVSGTTPSFGGVNIDLLMTSPDA